MQNQNPNQNKQFNNNQPQNHQPQAQNQAQQPNHAQEVKVEVKEAPANVQEVKKVEEKTQEPAVESKPAENPEQKVAKKPGRKPANSNNTSSFNPYQLITERAQALVQGSKEYQKLVKEEETYTKKLKAVHDKMEQLVRKEEEKLIGKIISEVVSNDVDLLSKL